jgi:hypothetical protein
MIEGLPSMEPSTAPVSASDTQKAVFELLVALLHISDAGAIMSSDFTPSGISSKRNAGLPSDQWIKQFALLENSAKAALQIGLSTYAIGPSTLNLEEESPMRVTQPEAIKGLCALQRMQSPGGFVLVYPLSPRFQNREFAIHRYYWLTLRLETSMSSH